MKYKYVEQMEELFTADALALFDALFASPSQGGAEKVYRRLKIAMEVRNTYYGEKYRSVADFLTQKGYPEEKIARFRAMRKENEK